MTWIVKATGGYEYCCHPEGTVYGPDLSDAYRFKDEAEAERVVWWLNHTMKDGLPYRVVRLVRPLERLRAAAHAVWDDAKPTTRPGQHTVQTRLIRELAWALGAPTNDGSNER
jgi:hypothetical protein